MNEINIPFFKYFTQVLPIPANLSFFVNVIVTQEKKSKLVIVFLSSKIDIFHVYFLDWQIDN